MTPELGRSPGDRKGYLLQYSGLENSMDWFPCGSAGKESTCNAGDPGLVPGLGRSPGEGKGYPLQYSGLENSMDWFPCGSAGKESTCNAGDSVLIPGSGRSPTWKRKWQPTPVLLPGKFHGWRSLAGYSPWGHKESDMTGRLHFLSLLAAQYCPLPFIGRAIMQSFIWMF